MRERSHQVLLNMGANEEKETQTEIVPPVAAPPLPPSTGISIS